MGEVYRARDQKLGRDVAIKFLPIELTTDHEHLARFEREARILASLNHPNVGGIHGLIEADGISGLVLEIVEGPTLAERLASLCGRSPCAAGARSAHRRNADDRAANRRRPRDGTRARHRAS